MSKRVPANPAKRFVVAFALTASLVGLWGFGHRLHDTLLPLFAAGFHLQGFRLALILSIYNVVYVCGALPAALYARRFGYKATILMGLGLVAVGAFTFYPAAETLAFSSYVIASICMALGWLTLEIAANPLLAAWGSPARAVFRLNLAQCLYPLGALAGIYIGRWLLEYDLALPQAAFSYTIAHPYIILGACFLLLAFGFEETHFPAVAQDRLPGLKGIGDEIKTLLACRLMRGAMIAQLCAIVAAGLTWAMIGDALRVGIPYLGFLQPRDAVLLCMALYGVGRIIGTALMHKIAPATVLLFYAAGGCLIAALAALFGGRIAACGLLGLGLALSITWPTILGLAIQGRGPEMKTATALIAITGALGAVVYHMALTAVGGLSSVGELAIAALCCAVIARYAWFCTTAAKTR